MLLGDFAANLASIFFVVSIRGPQAHSEIVVLLGFCNGFGRFCCGFGPEFGSKKGAPRLTRKSLVFLVFAMVVTDFATNLAANLYPKVVPRLIRKSWFCLVFPMVLADFAGNLAPNLHPKEVPRLAQKSLFFLVFAMVLADFAANLVPNLYPKEVPRLTLKS